MDMNDFKLPIKIKCDSDYVPRVFRELEKYKEYICSCCSGACDD